MNRVYATAGAIMLAILSIMSFRLGYSAGRENVRTTVVIQQDNLIDRLHDDLKVYKDPRRVRIVDSAIRNELAVRELNAAAGLRSEYLPENDVTSLMRDMIHSGMLEDLKEQ